MSYEGHYQALCQKGHQTGGFPVLYSVDEEQAQHAAWRCQARINNEICGSPVGETNSVDDTNCESEGIKKFIKLTEEELRTCDFGHVHVWTAATYQFSTERYHSVDGKLVVVSYY